MNWLFNFLGIVAYFLVRYKNRVDKTKGFSSTFWFDDNWAETLATIVINVLLVLLLYVGGIRFDLNQLIPNLPLGIDILGDAIVYAAIGAFISHGVYEMFASKVKK